MNEIIKEHFPVGKLPPELRGDLGADQLVTVTITIEETPPEEVLTLDQIFSLRQPPFRSAEEITEELRRQRDEWHD